MADRIEEKGINIVIVHRPNPGFSENGEGESMGVAVGEVLPGDVVIEKPKRVVFVPIRTPEGRFAGWK